MYSALINCGIKPWEFGDLTFPWLKMINEKGEVRESDESLGWKVRQSKANAREFMDKVKDLNLG